MSASLQTTISKCLSNADVDTLVHHHEYYLADGNLHLLVDNTLFCVHSHFFVRESIIFKNILDTPPLSPGRDREGSSDNTAIRIKNVTPDDFADFLWVFYDPKYSRIATVKKWTVILDIAYRWGFNEVKSEAINNLERLELPIIQRIALYQKYEAADEILQPHYATICSRPGVLTKEEADILGSATTIMIFQVRERLLCTQTGIKSLDKIEQKMFQKTVGMYFLSEKKKSEKKEGGEDNKSPSTVPPLKLNTGSANGGGNAHKLK